MSFEPIENYGVIGNMQSIGLVGMNGSIDFLSYPNFDSPTIFAALLISLDATPIADIEQHAIRRQRSVSKRMLRPWHV